VQSFNDPQHGHGMVVLLTRREDGRVDCYRQAGLAIDPAGYQIGGGLGDWIETTISPAHFEITDHGVDLDVCFHDRADRTIEVRVDDRDTRTRAPATLLAPLGAAIQHPTSLMLVWMRRFDLLRVTGREPEIRIDGRRVATGRLPGEWIHRRRLIKWAPITTPWLRRVGLASRGGNQCGRIAIEVQAMPTVSNALAVALFPTMSRRNPL
jgi:hypothetical protein